MLPPEVCEEVARGGKEKVGVLVNEKVGVLANEVIKVHKQAVVTGADAEPARVERTEEREYEVAGDVAAEDGTAEDGTAEDERGVGEVQIEWGRIANTERKRNGANAELYVYSRAMARARLDARRRTTWVRHDARARAAVRSPAAAQGDSNG